MKSFKYTLLLILLFLMACAIIPISTPKYKTISLFTNPNIPPLIFIVPLELPDINYNDYHNGIVVPIRANGFDYKVIMFYDAKTEDMLVGFVVCVYKYKVIAIVTPDNQWVYENGIPVQVTLEEIQTRLELGACSGKKT